MKTTLTFIFLVASISLSCSPPKDDKKPEGILTTAQEQTLQKAKYTEQLLKKTDEERQKILDETQE